ncbi:hypothetical protein [Actinoplanes sp. NPDC051411]|uniref:hypothetical protein n=1 Tax=Actinoplanes sp. NPDC051411 TaxID=3155522 RepID=UPI00341AA71D
MPARVILTVLALITGGYQVMDGIHVLATGVYMGSATPGPWRHVIHATGIDPMDFGPGFVVLGVCWLVAIAMLLSTSSRRAWWALLVIAVLTVWYLPVGTLTAVATIVVLLAARERLVRPVSPPPG